MLKEWEDRPRRARGAPSRPLRLPPGARRYAILRVKKLKTVGNIKASLDHTFRQRETPNADPDKQIENEILKGHDGAEGVLDAWQSRLPEKQRKNAVLAVEYLVTGSPEAIAAMSREEQEAYFRDALAWLEEQHGKDNVLSAVLHRDETTPHLTAMVIPLDEGGKLNARQFLGGRKVLSQMQTDFAECVGKPHQLERGLKNSRAQHVTIGEFYARAEIAKAAIDFDDLDTLKEQNMLLQARFEKLEVENARACAILAHGEHGWHQWQRYTAEAKDLLANIGPKAADMPRHMIEVQWYLAEKKRHEWGDNGWRGEFEESHSVRSAALDAVKAGFKPAINQPNPLPGTRFAPGQAIQGREL